MGSLGERFRAVLGKILDGSAAAPQQGSDGYPMLADDPLSAVHQQLEQLFQEANAQQRLPSSLNIDATLPTLATAKTLLDSPREHQVQTLLALTQRQVFLAQQRRRRWNTAETRTLSLCESCCQHLSMALLRRQQPFSQADLTQLVTLLSEYSDALGGFPVGLLWAQIKRIVTAEGAEPALLQALQAWQQSRYLETRLRHHIAALLAQLNGLSDPGVDAHDPWGAQVLGFLKHQDAATQAPWVALLQCCGDTASASKASARFLRQAQGFIDAIGVETYCTTLHAWLSTAAHCPPQQGFDPYVGSYQAWLLVKPNETRLRALIWTLPALAEDSLREPLAQLASQCFAKLPGVGPVAVKLGNSCLNTLAQMGLPGVATLTVLRGRIKHASARQRLESLIAQAAEQAGLSPGEIEDLAVPDYGLVAGCLYQPLGEYQAILQIGEDLKPVLHWQNDNGKVQKSVPAALKQEHPEALKALRQTLKAVQTQLTAQRQRLEGFYQQRRELHLDTWQQRFAQHGLLGCLSQRLLWRVGEQSVLWYDDAWRDATGTPLAHLPGDTPVELWHPLHASVAEISHWRRLLQARQLQQPFKQAFREVYLLTDAERQTRHYSNRFAAHLIKQHQFNALRQGRGWRYSLQGAWDGGNESTPERELPAWQLRAEFWVEGGGRLADSGVFLYLSTDQVRFYPTHEALNPLPLETVPPLVFSEVLRDVDLFVGVCSVGNDPTWQDQGDNPRWINAWQRFAFGELSTTAETRREVLAELLPKLKIREQCELHGRYLRVQGKRRGYKIHLGSSNILMEPNDQYLCIVPDRQHQHSRVFLPFDDDATLSLILSKAFLLAADEHITDTSILSQICFRG